MKSVAICTDEGRDLSKLINFEVLGGNAFCRLGLNNLEVDIIGLGNCTNSSRAGITLWREQRLAVDLKKYVQFNRWQREALGRNWSWS